MKVNLLERAHIDKAKYSMGLRTAILLLIYAVLNLIFQDFEHYVLMGLASANISVYIVKGIITKTSQNEANELFSSLTTIEIELLNEHIDGEPFETHESNVVNLVRSDLVIVKKRTRDDYNQIKSIYVVNPEYIVKFVRFIRKSKIWKHL